MQRATFKKVSLLLLKLVVSGILLTVVLRKAGIQNVVTQLREMDPRSFLLAGGLSILMVFLTAVRWGLLLGGAHRIGKLFPLCLLGSFFNHLLPGAVGGDAAKLYYLYRETRQGGKVFASVFLDRYVGYCGLLSLGLIAGIAAFRELAAVDLQWAAPLLFAAFFVGSLFVFGLRIGRRFAVVADFYDHFHATLGDRPAIVKAYALSIAIHVLAVLSVYTISRGIGQHPPLSELFVLVPLIITFMALPISISGFGLRESAFVLLFGLLGIPAEASASIAFLWYLSSAAASLPGLIVYVRLGRAPAGP